VEEVVGMAVQSQGVQDDQEDQPSQFGELFKKPAIGDMYGLGDKGFEAFIQYVFECAGYVVEYVGDQHYPKGPGVDLNLYADQVGGRLVARVEVRCFKPDTSLDLNHVNAFIGALGHPRSFHGFLVTTADFTQPACHKAKQEGRITLINGARLQRYIAYVRGSRLIGPAAPVAKALKLPALSPNYIVEADTIDRRDPTVSTVIAVANNKGGVAKTTTAMDIAFVLADTYHKRVLLIDMDGQASMTAALPPIGPKPPASLPLDDAHLSGFFAGHQSLPSLVRATRFPNVWLVPGHEHLFILDSGGAGRPQDELRWVRAVHDPSLVASGGGLFDWIIMDTPPAQSFFTRAALASSHYVLLPVNAEVFAVKGAQRALSTAATMQALVQRAANALGFLVTDWKQSAEAQKALTTLNDFARLEHTRVFHEKIPHDDRVMKGIDKSTGGWVANLLHVGAAPGPAAKAYEAFVKEMLPYVHRS
jgi:chromosome partitioning protein